MAGLFDTLPVRLCITYRGAFLSGFIARSNSIGHETTIDYKSAPRKQPSVIAVFGPVTSTPGSYELRIALLAEVPGHTDPHQYRHGIPVRVVQRLAPLASATF